MSPARVFEPTHKDNDLQTLTSALDALLVTVHQLSLREQELQRRVRLAHDEYRKLADRVEGGLTNVEQSVLEQIRPTDSQPLPKLDPSLKPLDVVDNLQEHGHIQRQLLDVVVAGIISSRSFDGDVRTDDNASLEVTSNNPCVVAAKARRSSLFERDFTTSNGVKGSLRCPYAKPSQATTNGHVNGTALTTVNNIDGQSSNTKCAFDPIKADQSTTAQDRASNTGASARSSAARCPIRYMDDHSPEELAKYFEMHKHEIPRSHAICVSRFQRNQSTMRQIDAKYGSLVNMIQGLGERHKPLLPESGQNGSSVERVEKWAEDVSSKSPHPATLSTVEEDEVLGDRVAGDEEDRVGHFERPLREIRVGESPSRPWGIPVPILNHNQPALGSAINSPAAPIHVPELKTPKLTNSDIPSAVVQLHDTTSPTPVRPKGKCPFDHTAFMKKPEPTADATLKEAGSPMYQQHMNSNARAQEDKVDNAYTEPKVQTSAPPPPSAPASNNPSQMVFNGPVFFGYSAEETAVLMQQLSSGK
ncbi:conserved hypothetical protein [Talaromyces stipitatus ATCC 10500]|uniref:Uncharacterized protein n=1 Tax=Talaromyces stipitatus (strain ATCC 10500 / CBS 375.48 / QM 6759 / NRRL 1006) TaxID=441959 RepID=B8MSS6_TALSN|nr:uncharacterized protein TSTA_006330 [Talaromyces stipitatus ATCC 10500]EED12608.1 conserved hypothetical protein [Talaromyces stipitatus ATCC 10500]